MKTALQIIQAAATQLGIASPTVAVGSTVKDVQQLLALLNQLGDDLQRDFIWQELSKTHLFTTQYLQTTATVTDGTSTLTAVGSTAGIDSTYQVVGTGINSDVFVVSVDSPTQVTLSQPSTASAVGETIYFCKIAYNMPSDYDRIQDRTQWDKSKHWEMLGPETAQMWAWLKSGYIATGPRIRWRILGGKFQIWPAVSSAEYLGFDYISNAWVRSASGVEKSSITADTDTCIFPDGLMIVGLKMMYQQAKGLGSEFVPQFVNLKAIAQANDAGSADLHMAPNPLNTLIGWENTPDSGYGS